MTIRSEYRRFRGYGHSRFVSVTLSVPFWLLFVIGLLIGYIADSIIAAVS